MRTRPDPRHRLATRRTARRAWRAAHLSVTSTRDLREVQSSLRDPARARARLADDELYFRRHGLPLLIEDYSATEDVLNRALPWLVVIFVLQAATNLVTSWAPGYALGAAGLGLAVAGAAWVATNLARGRRALAPPARVGWWSAAVFVIVPSLAKLFADDGPTHALRHLVFNTWLCALVVATIGWGLIPTTVWALLRMVTDLGRQLLVVLRQMSAIFLFSFLLFFTQEVWQLAETADTTRLTVVAVGLGGFALLVLVSGTPRLARSLAEDLTGPDDALTWAQRLNLTLLLAVRQALQVLVIMGVTTGFFAAFGTFVVGPALYKAWSLNPVVWLEVQTGDHVFEVTRTLLAACGVVGLITGLNFAIVSLTSAEGREMFLAGLEDELAEVFRRRRTYRAVRAVLLRR